MKEVKIISLSGNIGAGKSYIANIAVNRFGYKFLMLAAIPKEIVCRVNGINLKYLEDRKNKEKYRQEIINYAEKLKEVNSHIFCKDVYQRILKDLGSTNPTYKYLVSDARYPFEALYFRKLGRCSKCKCEVEHIGIPGYDITFKSLYIESDLADKSSKDDSESHYQYFKDTNDGVIFNGTEQRYSRDNLDLINQLVKFI